MTGLVFHLIPHTHWDREWYLSHGAFRARLVAMVDDLISRLERQAGLRSFLLDGQTVLVEDYLQVRPDRSEAVRALVATGRLQVGPWYVLADELIPSGESLIRNLLFGTADAERLGHRLDVLYSPDAFGHPAAWPALAREFGIRGGVLWRGLGGSPGEEGDRYRWRAPDGREVFVWHMPAAGYEIGAGLPADPARLPAAWGPVRAALVARARGVHIPVFIGADHRHAHPALPRLRELLAELEAEHTVRISRLDEFCQAAAAEERAPPLLSGERRWSYRHTWTLQGVHGTRAPLKRRHALLELWLERLVEPLAAAARRAGGGDRRSLLEAAWRLLVRCQFHDTICGSVSDAVAVALGGRLAKVEALAREMMRGGVHDLVRHDPDAAREDSSEAEPTLVLWNPAARPRGGIVVCDLSFFRRDVAVGPPSARGAGPREGVGMLPFSLVGPEGERIPVQLLDRRTALERLDAPHHYPDQDLVDTVRVAFRAPLVPGLGAVAVRAATPPFPPAETGARVEARNLVNDAVVVALEPSGALALIDRTGGQTWTGLMRLESSGDVGDTYTYCPPARDRVVRAGGPIRVRRVAGGPVLAALEVRQRLRCGLAPVRPGRGSVDARLVVQLHADTRVVRCLLDVDNHATWHRLRVRIPTGLAGVPAVAGSAFTAVERPAVRIEAAEYPEETPVLTAPAQRFVAVAGPRGAPGLAVLAPGFFEYELTPAGDLLITVLRAVGTLSRGDLPARPGHAGWPVATPGAQCLGPDRIELALAPVTREQVERGDVVPRLWEEVFLPVRGFWLRDARAVSPAATAVALEGAGLVLSAVKPAQAGAAGSGMVLRCYNATDHPASGAWRFARGVRAAYRMRADERESLPLVLEERGRTVRFAAGPHEIVTILVE